MSDFGAPALASLLTQDDLAFIQSLANRRAYRDGEMIHDRGDPDPAMGLVVRGRIKLITPRSCGRETFITFVNPGSHYGDIGLLDRRHRVHRALALGETEVDCVSREDFPRLLERPAIVRALYEIAAYRLSLLIDVMDDMRGLPPEVRLGKLLYTMYVRSGSEPRIEFLQEDIANLLGVSTVTLSKGLRHLRELGLADTGYRQIVITDPVRLQQWLAVHDPV
jgi:CRP/FNR family transcriptional regulator, cyclic AMP receptor protein